MKVRRDINAIPVRSAAETWQRIVSLISGPDSVDRTALDAVGGIVASIITDEHPAREPFIVSGVGPRLVVYCQFGSEAITGDENAAALSWNPTGGDWQLAVPCDPENLPWVKKALSKKSARVIAYDLTSPEITKDITTKAAAAELTIDWTAGGRL